MEPEYRRRSVKPEHARSMWSVLSLRALKRKAGVVTIQPSNGPGGVTGTRKTLWAPLLRGIDALQPLRAGIRAATSRRASGAMLRLPRSVVRDGAVADQCRAREQGTAADHQAVASSLSSPERPYPVDITIGPQGLGSLRSGHTIHHEPMATAIEIELHRSPKG